MTCCWQLCIVNYFQTPISKMIPPHLDLHGEIYYNCSLSNNFPSTLIYHVHTNTNIAVWCAYMQLYLSISVFCPSGNNYSLSFWIIYWLPILFKRFFFLLIRFAIWMMSCANCACVCSWLTHESLLCTNEINGMTALTKNNIRTGADWVFRHKIFIFSSVRF